MKKIAILLLAVFSLVGCSKEIQTKFAETSVGTYAKSFDDVSNFSNVYGMWKKNIDTLYIQAGNDEYTDTYLLKRMPSSYTTVIKSLNKYDMKAYALLDSDLWLENKNKDAMDEVWNILRYNKKNEETRFKGININMNLENVTAEETNAFYDNLVEAKKLIDTHNTKDNDALILSINADKSLLENEVFSEIGNTIDEVIYNDKNSSIDQVEDLLSSMDKYDNKVVIEVDSKGNFFEDNYVSILKDLNEKLDHFNKYESFSGFVINDYNKYTSFLEKQKRP